MINYFMRTFCTIIITIFALCNPMTARAGYFSRIRPSDISDKYHALTDNIMLMLGFVFLIILLCVAIVYVWQVHKAKVKSIVKFLFVCLCIYIILAMGNGIYYIFKHQRNASAEKGNNVQVVSSTTVQTEENNYSREAPADAWAAYPPARGDVTEGADNDWLVAATNNPTYSIYDLMRIGGMTPDNTQFLSEEKYKQSHWVREHYTPEELHHTYKKLSSAWKTFMRCKGADVSSSEIEKYMIDYDMFDTDKPQISDADNPQLIKDLQRVPMQY